MKYSPKQRSLSFALSGIALTIVLLSAPAFASSGSNCTTASIPEPFMLPDGTEHGAGTLKLCVERRHSPVSHMHETYVDGMAVGLHIGRTNSSEGPATAGSYVMFGRGTDGRLRLLGYARPGIDHMQVFSLRRAIYITADPQLADRVREEPIFIAALPRPR
jgi:hypothetical protein